MACTQNTAHTTSIVTLTIMDTLLALPILTRTAITLTIRRVAIHTIMGITNDFVRARFRFLTRLPRLLLAPLTQSQGLLVQRLVIRSVNFMLVRDFP